MGQATISGEKFNAAYDSGILLCDFFNRWGGICI